MSQPAWAQKNVWELTEDDITEARDTLRFHPYHDFDLPTQRSVYVHTAAYAGQRFLTNADVIKGESYIRAYTCTGLPIFVSKFAYDRDGNPLKYMISIHRHESISVHRLKTDDRLRRSWHDACEHFRREYDWNSTNGSYDKEKYEQDFGTGAMSHIILTTSSQIVTGQILT